MQSKKSNIIIYLSFLQDKKFRDFLNLDFITIIINKRLTFIIYIMIIYYQSDFLLCSHQNIV